MGSPYLANGLFLSLPWFYRSGYDVLLYTLPFHGRRAERFSPFSGYGFFSTDSPASPRPWPRLCTTSVR